MLVLYLFFSDSGPIFGLWVLLDNIEDDVSALGVPLAILYNNLVE